MTQKLLDMTMAELKEQGDILLDASEKALNDGRPIEGILYAIHAQTIQGATIIIVQRAICNALGIDVPMDKTIREWLDVKEDEEP